MVRVVRNFWLAAHIDDAATNVSIGPRAKDGGMSLVIDQRADGDISMALRIECRVKGETLITDVYGPDGKLLYSHRTTR